MIDREKTYIVTGQTLAELEQQLTKLKISPTPGMVIKVLEFVDRVLEDASEFMPEGMDDEE